MSINKDFLEKYKNDNLKEYYFHQIKFKSAPGIDKINSRLFEKNLSFYINVISSKVIAGTYSFTSYKERLISKDRNKKPRLISIPTIRDKVTLGVLKEILFNAFKSDIDNKLVQTIMSEVIQTINNSSISYDYFFKLDIKNFYGSINHKVLFRKLKKRIRKKQILELIDKAIKTSTIVEKSSKKHVKNIKGVPQGLAISNILASIYLIDFDKKHNNSSKYCYFRYVDDILVICNQSDYQSIKNKMVQDIEKKYLLWINKDKEDNNFLTNGFNYLGYHIKKNLITVKRESILKLENKLENIFIEHHNCINKNENFFIWSLNQKITGCIVDNKKYGWTFFFSQINDFKLLFHLDWLVKKLFKRFKISSALETKSFVRTYHEIKNNLYRTRYIPKYDEYDIEKKKQFLYEIINRDIDNWEDEKVEIEFNKIIFKSVKELEKDMQNFS